MSTNSAGTYNEVSCPVCHNRDAKPLYRYTVSQAASHFCPPSRDPARYGRLLNSIRRLWEGNECVILQCGNCQFGFAHPFVGGDEEFYHILHVQKDYPAWRWDYDVAVAEAVEKFTEGKILDIGAGVGMFLARLNQNWDRYAVEGSEVTRCELEASNVTVFRDMDKAVQSHAGSFQVVTLFQVLEHIAEFDILLKQCYELLAPGGRLVITVPDGDAMIRQERITGCADMPPNHIGKWTPTSLTRVLTPLGFECSEPLAEPSSWKNLKANLHMRVSADAANHNTLAAQAYRVRSKTIRKVTLSLLAGPALMRMFHHRMHLRTGGAFAIVSRRCA